MDFHEELYSIHQNWIHGRIPKRDAVREFEGLMRRANILPVDCVLDQNLEDATFTSLINQAFALTIESLKMLQNSGQTQALAKMFDKPPHSLFKCPICRKDFPRLFAEVAVREEDRMVPHESYKIDPARCESCARDWLDEHVLGNKPRTTEPHVAPLSLTERSFFRPYEEQMKEPDKS